MGPDCARLPSVAGDGRPAQLRVRGCGVISTQQPGESDWWYSRHWEGEQEAGGPQESSLALQVGGDKSLN